MIRQTPLELKKHLKEQITFLKLSALAFDRGFEDEAKRLATNIRVLLHDTPKSKSLLSQLRIKDGLKFFDSSVDFREQGFAPHMGLVYIRMSPNSPAKYIAVLDDLPPSIGKKVDFDEYWNKPIFVDNKKNSFSRKKLILAIANKDGGAHIDPSLDEKYAALSRKNSLGWTYSNSTYDHIPIESPHLVAVRQITHEIIRTLDPKYPLQKSLSKQGGGVVFGGITFEKPTTGENNLS